MNVLAVFRFRVFLRKQFWQWLPLLAALALTEAAHAAVGRLAGSGDVSPMGAATYTIPIEVAAGINGLKPEIALSYDSQSGDGLAGVGWTLSGFSKIYRCPRTRPLDGNMASGVTYTASDRFCLDGAPLIQISGSTYGADNVEYRAEVHSYQKVVSKGTQGTGPSSFEVSLPNGLTYFYGNDADSLILAPGTNNEVRVWALNTIRDKFGNQINFHYTSPVTGEYVPDEVTWTSNGGTAPYKLVFTYEDLNTVLPDAVRSGYVWGSQWQATRRLQTIEYYFDGSLVHRYALSYTSGSTGKSRLQSVQQWNGDDSDHLPATTFTWQDGGTGFGSEQSGPVVAVDDYDYAVFGDINGDGATDAYIPVSGVWHVMYANPATGTFNAPQSIGLLFFPSPPVYFPPNARVLDYDGDGRADLMAVNADGDFYVYLASGSGCTSGICGTGISLFAISALSPHYVLDINGDGLTDFFYRQGDDYYFHINEGAGFGSAQLVNVSAQLGGEWSYANETNVGDIDGDGRQDLAITRLHQNYNTYTGTLSAYRSYWNGVRNDFELGFDDAISSSSPVIPQPILPDLNGDGLSDLLYWVFVVSYG